MLTRMRRTLNDGQHSARLLELTRGCKGQRHLLFTRGKERAFWADRNARAKALWPGEGRMRVSWEPEGSQCGWKERRHLGGGRGGGGGPWRPQKRAPARLQPHARIRSQRRRQPWPLRTGRVAHTAESSILVGRLLS